MSDNANASTATPADNHAGATAAQPREDNSAAAKATFELPEEDARTALKVNDRKLVVDLRTGDVVLEPIARDRSTATQSLVLVCLDPGKKKTAPSDAALYAAKRLVRSGDTVILMSVLPLHTYSDEGLPIFGNVYGSGSQVDTLRQMRKDRMGELRGLAKNFPEGVQLYGRVVNGGPARQILFAAEETNCTLVIIGKRKLGTWEKLVTP
ncbi:hypothetical protein P389DRAFT_43340 [Cystobasidium minutum MCA 4210]|uniref:uncharacterized protein n=1 Tax=Cystobasidium minutum MCA 4210 TaxID=1397322 RepID=UPI0034CDBFFA|eukprot:jgi/Rhomi1/43340/CE43339_16838